MVFTKVVVAGSTGRVANHVIPLLLASTQPKFDVTLLTRANSGRAPKATPGARTIPVDYNDHEGLVRALQGADVLLSLIAGFPSKAIDRLLLKAAEESGVRRMFPSEHSLDVLHPAAAKILTEGGTWHEDLSAVHTAKVFTSLPERGSSVSFTTVMPGAFLSGWLNGEFGMFDPKNRKVSVLDGGDHYFTGVSYPYLAAATVAILQMDEEETKNKRIPIAEVRTTMNEIADNFDEVTKGAKFERVDVPSEAILKQRDERLAAAAATTKYDEIVEHSGMANVFGVLVAAFNGSGSGDFKGALSFDADGRLRVEKKPLREFVAEALHHHGVQ